MFLFSEFHLVTEEFHSKIPTIKFMTHSNLQCELTLSGSGIVMSPPPLQPPSSLPASLSSQEESNNA